MESVRYLVRGLNIDNFEVEKIQQCFDEVWHSSFLIAAVYLAVVYGSERYVTKKHDIKKPLALWNAFLAVFSIYGAINVTWMLWADLMSRGFDDTVCWSDYYKLNSRKTLAYWLYLFCLSKFPELFDTAFIILRKAPLQLLHTYHHASVLVFSWHVLATGPSASYWYAAMNYFVHAVMYTYYCIRSLDVKVPVVLAKCITSMQSLQMLVGFSVNFYSLYRKYNGHECGNTYVHSIFAILLYFSYFVLFIQFAIKRYGSKPKAGKTPEMAKDKKQ